jgi:two-component system, NtrC family, sensor kinase
VTVKRLFDLSLQHKLPLWGSLLIICTALAIGAAYVYQTVGSLKQTMLERSEIFGRSVAVGLAYAIKKDDAILANNIIAGPLRAQLQREYFQIGQVLVLDRYNKVFASTSPEQYPIGANLGGLGASFDDLNDGLAATSGSPDQDRVVAEGPQMLQAIPLISEGATQGWLVMIHPKAFRLSSIGKLATQAAMATALVLVVVLPISWYWGRRMAVPLVTLAKHMRIIGREIPTRMAPGLYVYGDEVGQLFKAYDQLCDELEEKEAIKQEMIQSERLAALGRLSAGVAHEINNPLAGLITAVDTLKHHSNHDPLVDRVLPLLDRGLMQIRDIVSALLVETRAKSHPLTVSDIDDVQTLLNKEAQQHGVEWNWNVQVEGEVALPSTLVRQALMNLLLNAIQAAGQGGRVDVEVKYVSGRLIIEVINDGQEIPPEVKHHLFEPFAGKKEGGHGLGLWVTYQIVQQLHGRIKVARQDGQTSFMLNLPEAARP